MKRTVTISVLAILLAFATNTFAQSKGDLGRPRLTPEQIQADAKCAAQVFSGKLMSPYQGPGTDPIVTESEHKKAFPNQVLSDIPEITSLLYGTYNKVTDKGLQPISDRLWERIDKFFGVHDEDIHRQVMDRLSNSQVDRVKYLPLTADCKAPAEVLTQPQVFGSRGKGTITDYPPIPIRFKLLALLLRSITPKTGTYAGRPVRLAITTGFIWEDGTVQRPCINLSGVVGFAAEQVVEQTTKTPSTEGVFVPDSKSAGGALVLNRAAVGPGHHGNGKKKFVIGLLIGAAAVGTACAVALCRGVEVNVNQNVNVGTTSSAPTEIQKPNPPVTSRPPG